MANRMNWENLKRRRMPTEPAWPKLERKGAWTHVRREPVRTYNADEIAAFQEKLSVLPASVGPAVPIK